MAAFYLDHDVDVVLADLLRARGHQATTVRDLGLERASDAEHLLLAAQRGWLFVTRNGGHFLVLHQAWRLWSAAWNVPLRHAGILIIPHGRIRELAFHIAEFPRMDLPVANALYEWHWQRGWLPYRTVQT